VVERFQDITVRTRNKNEEHNSEIADHQRTSQGREERHSPAGSREL
jgi:hypothetical protein